MFDFQTSYPEMQLASDVGSGTRNPLLATAAADGRAAARFPRCDNVHQEGSEGGRLGGRAAGWERLEREGKGRGTRHKAMAVRQAGSQAGGRAVPTVPAVVKPRV